MNLEAVAREIAWQVLTDDVVETFIGDPNSYVTKHLTKAEQRILAALLKVEAETVERCAKRCDQYHDTGIQLMRDKKLGPDQRMTYHAQALAAETLASSIRSSIKKEAENG